VAGGTGARLSGRRSQGAATGTRARFSGSLNQGVTTAAERHDGTRGVSRRSGLRGHHELELRGCTRTRLLGGRTIRGAQWTWSHRSIWESTS
jgi:hypothetical protein